MSRQGKREVVERLRHRYLRASRTEKGKILDEFVALSGMHRKSAIRALRQGAEHPGHLTSPISACLTRMTTVRLSVVDRRRLSYG